MNLTEKLRKYREEKGYTQESMAHNIGVSYGTYSNMENGKTDIRFSLLEKCAKTLNISLFELLPDEYKEDL
ncbi:MAG TPA: helix-turn-helix transcriptional regulator [Moheibacter sp.]|nr:helix-turn-helix transcriptional regulator [Moheibacter sp.]